MAGGNTKNIQDQRQLIFVNRFFHPDESATSLILTDLARYLAGSGRTVTVVTSQLSYTNADKRYPAREDWSGIEIARVRTTGFGRGSLLGRAADYLSFYASSFLSVLKRARRHDVVISKTDPPMLGMIVGFAARLKGARRVNWLQDVFPEVATALGFSLPGRALLRALRNRSLSVAHLNVAVGSRMAAFVEAETRGRAETVVIPNATVCESATDPEVAAQLRAAWGYRADDFIIGYFGNLGRAHDIDTVMKAATLLRGERRIQFLFVGGGHLLAEVDARADALALTNVETRTYVPRGALAQSLCLPNLHWLTLVPSTEALIVPSKIYGIAAAGRPALFVGSPVGEIGQILDRHGFGQTIAPGDGASFAQAVLALKADRGRMAVMGQAARAFAEGEGAQARAFALWDAALDWLRHAPVRPAPCTQTLASKGADSH